MSLPIDDLPSNSESGLFVRDLGVSAANVPCRWAWHNTHITKRIADEQRITAGVTRIKTSPKTGRTRKRTALPRPSLIDKISNLHLLLRVPSFARWPLKVHFFCEDVYKAWERWSERVDGKIRGDIQILLDVKQPLEAVVHSDTPLSMQAKGKQKLEAVGKGGIEGLDTGYGNLTGHVEKSIFLLGEDESIMCAVCSDTIGPSTAMALVCPSEDCKAVFHMSCLAMRFLVEESGLGPIMPTLGRCPTCRVELRWIDLVKEMSLRANGGKEVAQLMKKPSERKAKASNLRKANSFQELGEKLKDGDDDREEGFVEDSMHAGAAADDALPDDWYYQGDDDDMMSVTSAASGFSDSVDAASPIRAAASRLGVVIEDSEGDDAESLI